MGVPFRREHDYVTVGTSKILTSEYRRKVTTACVIQTTSKVVKKSCFVVAVS